MEGEMQRQTGQTTTESRVKTESVLGVSDMRYVSGTAEYSFTFTAPENWSSYAGAMTQPLKNTGL